MGRDFAVAIGVEDRWMQATIPVVGTIGRIVHEAEHPLGGEIVAAFDIDEGIILIDRRGLAEVPRFNHGGYLDTASAPIGSQQPPGSVSQTPPYPDTSESLAPVYKTSEHAPDFQVPHYAAAASATARSPRIDNSIGDSLWDKLTTGDDQKGPPPDMWQRQNSSSLGASVTDLTGTVSFSQADAEIEQQEVDLFESPVSKVRAMFERTSQSGSPGFRVRKESALDSLPGQDLKQRIVDLRAQTQAPTGGITEKPRVSNRFSRTGDRGAAPLTVSTFTTAPPIESEDEDTRL